MHVVQNVLIGELLLLTQQAKENVKIFKSLTEQELNWRPAVNQWSILECLEHLNLYGEFYLAEIERVLLKSDLTAEPKIFKSGLLGNYFVSLMKTSGGEVKKMKTPKDKNPLNSPLSITTINRFLKQLERLEALLNQSQKVDLTRAKTAISLSRFIKLRLGDTLRFVVFHNERHIVQAQRVMASMPSSDKREATSQLVAG